MSNASNGDEATRRDALARSIAARLLCCDELELRRLDRELIEIETERAWHDELRLSFRPPREMSVHDLDEQLDLTDDVGGEG